MVEFAEFGTFFVFLWSGAPMQLTGGFFPDTLFRPVPIEVQEWRAGSCLAEEKPR
jgi:hypothetical protein